MHGVSAQTHHAMIVTKTHAWQSISPIGCMMCLHRHTMPLLQTKHMFGIVGKLSKFNQNLRRILDVPGMSAQTHHAMIVTKTHARHSKSNRLNKSMQPKEIRGWAWCVCTDTPCHCCKQSTWLGLFGNCQSSTKWERILDVHGVSAQTHYAMICNKNTCMTIQAQ